MTTDRRADMTDTSDEAVAKVLRRCYDERELPEWGDFLKASEAIATLSRQLAEAQAAIEQMTDAIEPFVNTARRMGWDKLSDPEDFQTLIQHVVEAPAEDMAPGAIYVLQVSAFTDLAAALNPTPPREEKS
jgi:hypothetical protein